MPGVGPGSGGGGGAGTLGPPTNSFTAATKSAAETLRDNYATANAVWLAAYDAETTFSIEISWPLTPANTVYQSRRSSAWADVTPIIRGPRGPIGKQARFTIYAYINATIAPAAAPTGGTFVQSTDALTVPTGYTATPTTPVATANTYRTEAEINPVSDADTVALVWSVPAELPAYLAAALAEAAQVAAEAARDLAQQYAGQAQDIPAGSPRGVLVATSPTLPTAAVANNSVIAFGAAELWTLGADAPDGFEAGPAASNERLYLPDIHPPGSNGIWVVAEVGGVDIAEVFISQGGIQGATGADRRTVIPVSATADVLVRIGFWHRASTVASYIQITGNADTLPADVVIKIYLAVVRGVGGSGPGGGISEARAQQLIDATNLSALQGMVTDGQIPAAIMRDAELTATAVRSLLGLTAAEVEDLLTGATITGQVVTFTQNDGTTTTITIPAGSGGLADGVVTAAVLSGTELTLTIDTDGVETDVTVDLAALTTGFLSTTQFNALRGNRLMIGAGAAYDATANTLTVTPPFVAIVGDDTRFVAPATVDDATDDLDFVEDITGGRTFALNDFDGTPVSAVRLTAGRVYSALRLTNQWRILESLEAAPAQAHQLWAGWSADAIVTEDEVLAGVSSDTDMLTLPLGSGNQYLFIWRSDADGGDPTEVYFAGGFNSRNVLGDAAALTVDGVAGQLIVSVGTQNVSLLGGEDLRVV